MTIEVRQLVIRSTVGEARQPGGDPLGHDAEAAVIDEEWVREFRRELLDECKRWVDKRLTGHEER